MKYKILLARPKVPLLTYSSMQTDLQIGNIVSVPFRNAYSFGIVWQKEENISKNIKYEIKEIQQIYDFIKLEKNFIDFLKTFSRYYMIDMASVCKMVFPINNIDFIKFKKINNDIQINLPNLSIKQTQIYEKLKATNEVSILQGVTGSGKTEIYFHLIADNLQKGKQVLVMLPEIGLTNQIIDRFEKTFGQTPGIWHSSITKAKKRDIYYNIATGNQKVVIGTRSSLFLPFKNLGLVIVDEEHDSSYKQEELNLYNARDSAVLRGQKTGAKIVLVSATPSIESYNNALNGKYHHVFLDERFLGVSMPEVEIVDMKKEEKDKWISSILCQEISKAIYKKQQSILFINRRGFAPLMLCSSCSFRFSCSNCSSWLVHHKKENRLICHHCGHNIKIPSLCPECNEESLISCGPGVERIEAEAKTLFPKAKICCFSKDNVSTLENTKKLIKEIESGIYDIIIGTQMLTKGYHFPNVTVVGVIDGDVGSSNIDLKANERCFQILNQVGGRAGRENNEGKMIIQSYFPDNPLFQTIKNYNLEEFYKIELESRKNNYLPPIVRAACIIITGSEELKVRNFSWEIKSLFKGTDKIQILGPAPATMSKIKGKYRFRILILADKKIKIQEYINQRLEKINNNKFNLRVEIDPYSFY